jgi:hypothetical protein
MTGSAMMTLRRRFTPALIAFSLAGAGCAGSGTSTQGTTGTASSGPTPSTITATATVATTAPTTDPAAGDTTTAADDTVAAVPDKLRDDVTVEQVAAMIAAAGLGCSDISITADDPGSTTMTLAPAPEMTEGTCTASDGTPLGITVAADADQARIAEAQLTLYAPMMAAFGVLEIAYVEAGPDKRVWVAVDTPDTEQGTAPQARPSAANLDLLDDIADVIDGTVRRIET